MYNVSSTFGVKDSLPFSLYIQQPTAGPCSLAFGVGNIARPGDKVVQTVGTPHLFQETFPRKTHSKVFRKIVKGSTLLENSPMRL